MATTLLTESFSLGIRAAAPAMVALLLVTLIMGIISRTLPQLNVMSFGFGISALATLGALWVSVGSIAWVFQEQLEPALETMLDALGGSS
jgi:flagellar biosynthetic protein FliR